MIATLLGLALATQATKAPLLDQRRADLLQFEVRLPDTLTAGQRAAAVATFTADTRTIRACRDAVRIAARYKDERRFSGSVTTRRNAPIGALPAPLRTELARVPTGQATRPFGSDKELRVLVACTEPRIPPNAASKSAI